MGSLLKVTKDEIAKRAPGRERGPVEKARGTRRKATAVAGTRSGRRLTAGWMAAKGTATATKGVAGLIKQRRDRKRTAERRRKAKIAAAAGAVTAAGGAVALKMRGSGEREAPSAEPTPADTVGNGPAQPVVGAEEPGRVSEAA